MKRVSPKKKAVKKSGMFAIDFGTRLRAIREGRGLSQKDLADRLHTRPPQVSRYENGSQLPNVETLASIAQILHTDMDELALGKKSDSPPDALGIKDVRLIERMRELEQLDRKARETAIAMLDAIIVQGHQEAVKARLVGAGR
jgi:transcriptional regulator with XRE-family HTH domain